MIALDDITFNYIYEKPMAPKNEDWDKAVNWWKTLPSDSGAKFDKIVDIDIKRACFYRHITYSHSAFH
jgi:3-isopropylmalate/(R)-2-methylmalate dehydratase large subunit